MSLNLKRDRSAVASAVLAFVSSEQNGGLTTPAGDPQPVIFAPQLSIEPPKISTTVKDPKVLLDPKLLTIAVAGVVVLAFVVTMVVKGR